MRKDRYNKWKDEGVLNEKIEQIKEFYSYKKKTGLIFQELGISESTWERMKRNYPDIKEAMTLGKKLHEHELISFLTERSKGFYYEEQHTLIEESNGKQKKKITKFKKYIPGDVHAAKYLLSRLHGEKYNDNIEMIKIARKKQKNTEEVWSVPTDENTIKED